MIKRANFYMLFLILYIQIIGYVMWHFIDAVSIHVLQSVSLLLTFAVPFGFYIIFTKEKLTEILPLKPLSISNAILAICLSILIMPAMMGISAASSLIFDNNVEVFLDEAVKYPIIPVLISAAVLPAALEEITFRGIILTNFKKLSIKKAAVLSGLFFGLIHMDLQQFPYAFLMGIVFAVMVHYTKSIYASVLSHFIINAAMITLIYAAGDLEQFPLFTALMVSAPALFLTFRYFISYNLRNVTDETTISDTSGKSGLKAFTWELGAVLVVYFLLIAAVYL